MQGECKDILSQVDATERAAAAAAAEAAAQAQAQAKAKAQAKAAEATAARSAMSIATLLEESKVSEYPQLDDECTVGDWLRVLTEQGRPALISRLKDVGFSKLTERQAIASALGKAQREGRA